MALPNRITSISAVKIHEELFVDSDASERLANTRACEALAGTLRLGRPAGLESQHKTSVNGIEAPCYQPNCLSSEKLTEDNNVALGGLYQYIFGWNFHDSGA